MRAFLLLGLLFAALACTDHGETQMQARSIHRSDSAIYAVLLDSLRPGSHAARVVRQYEQFPDSEPESMKIAVRAAAQGVHLDSALIVALYHDQHAGSVAETLGNVPGIRWIDRGSVRAETLRPGKPTRVVGLSRIAYSADSTRAIVYAWMWCEGLCGNGSFYQFHRLPGHDWRLVGTVVRFIS